jgi:hypothetical protein
MKIFRVKIEKRILTSLPEKELLFLIYLGTALNEINILHKMIFLSNRKRDNDIEIRAQNCQTAFLLAILTGKLCEAWVMITNFYLKGQLSKEYSPLLEKDAKDSLDNLKKYFGAKGGWFARIRNQISFHYDVKPENLLKIIENLNDTEKFEIYLSTHQGNTLFFSSSAYMMLTALNMGGEFDDVWQALDKYFTEVADVTSWTLTFLNSCLVAIAKKQNWTRQYVDENEIPDPPNAFEFYIPFFLNKPTIV